MSSVDFQHIRTNITLAKVISEISARVLKRMVDFKWHRRIRKRYCHRL